MDIIQQTSDNRILLIDNGKKVKNHYIIYRLRRLHTKGIEPLAYRLFCYSKLWNKLNFTFDSAKGASYNIIKLNYVSYIY